MGTREEPPGARKSWAEVLGSTLPPNWNKNVFKIVLEKDNSGPFFVSENECAKLLTKIGVIFSGSGQIEAVQVCPNGRGVILVTLKANVMVDNFICGDVILVTESGIRAVNIKPAGKREVIVTIKWLHPNNKDEGVINYLSKFGKVVSTKVTHCVYKEGPFQVLKNGDRSYKIEVKPDKNIPTYHVLFGQKVTFRYPGQRQTCARCFKASNMCMGGGIAKRCEVAGGQRRDFSEYILEMWESVSYTPGEIEVASLYDDDGKIDFNDITVHQGERVITPKQVKTQPSKWGGVSVKNFP